MHFEITKCKIFYGKGLPHYNPEIREVNNRLTGWAFAHLVNYFAHPVNLTCPLSKIAHPVYYLAQRNNRH